jgi:hypothetical protein
MYMMVGFSSHWEVLSIEKEEEEYIHRDDAAPMRVS